MVKSCRIEEMIRRGELELDLDTESNKEISDHIVNCSECGKLVSDLKKVTEAVRSAARISVSDSFDFKLRMRLEQEKQVKTSASADRTPFIKRAFYYVSGVAAVVIAVFYAASLGVFDIKNGVPSSPSSVQISEKTEINGGSVIDSLENMNKNVTSDEDMRLKVSTGE